MQHIDVSVIVTTKNEEKNIGNCLQSIKEQTYPQEKIEIIVVDNNSTDNTREIAEKYTEKVYTCGPERSAQRNYGVERAIGKYILYLDADMILSDSVIDEALKKCEKNDLIALYIPEVIIGNKFWIKVRNFERSFYNATCIDCVRFIRRDKFLELGGFDLNLTGPEDWDFDRRLNEIGEIDIIDSPLYHNEGEFNLSGYLKKKAYYSNSFDKYIAKWGKNDHIIKKQFSPWYRVFGIFIENGKWKRLVKHPVLSLGVFFLRFMVGFTFLWKKLND